MKLFLNTRHRKLKTANLHNCKKTLLRQISELWERSDDPRGVIFVPMSRRSQAKEISYRANRGSYRTLEFLQTRPF